MEYESLLYHRKTCCFLYQLIYYIYYLITFYYYSGFTEMNHNLRCIARNFWGQGRFLLMRAQILNSSERLNDMQTLPSTCLKNKYLYQILIILADIQAQAYNFMIKRIPRDYNIFTKKNKRCYVSLHTPYIGSLLSRGHQTVTMNLMYYF